MNKKQLQHEIELFSKILFFGQNVINLNDEVEEYEKQFFCGNCKNTGIENFVYRCHFSGGQTFICDECHSPIVVAIKK